MLVALKYLKHICWLILPPTICPVTQIYRTKMNSALPDQGCPLLIACKLNTIKMSFQYRSSMPLYLSQIREINHDL